MSDEGKEVAYEHKTYPAQNRERIENLEREVARISSLLEVQTKATLALRTALVTILKAPLTEAAADSKIGDKPPTLAVAD
jgi:hypothetical protein